MKRVNAGKYRHTVAFYVVDTPTAALETDDAGQPVPTTAPAGYPRAINAEVKCTGSEEVSHSQTAGREDTYEVRCRYDRSLLHVASTKGWMVFGHRRLDITGILDVECLNIELLVTAVARGNARTE